ncbi:MAG: ribonuclease Y, partial [Chloroflexi bacterium]|nr:ribonuclease Y [Chloroflexota bacterium]
VSVVPLPNEDLKGRIIGREGRNIRAMEAATGVDIIIDDTPDSVTVSAFDPVRREIARLALTRLVADGRIHPARIEEVVVKARQEVENTIRQEGERLVYEAEVHGLHPELIRLLGRMKFRFSYGQNLSKHSLEVAHLAAMIAAEMGLDIKMAKEAGLLHDIGKVVDHEVEGPHALIGGDVLRRYGRPEPVIVGVAAHHYETEPNIYAVITSAADAISGGRPGARRESTDQYIKRLEALERLASAFPGVERCYAIQAGREIRALVKPEEIDDLAALQLARELAKRIEETLEYPGQIKVTVLRETRAVEYAR